jgi:hypothetical protein
MQLFLTLFSHWLQFSYSCFDRVILKGYLSVLSRPANIVYWIREVQGQPKVTKEFLRERTNRYQGWVESYAKNNHIPIDWADNQRKESRLKPFRERAMAEGQFGVYYILKSREQGPAFTCHDPKYPAKDPNYVIVRKTKRTYTYYYFYIYDEELGPIYLRIGSYPPFEATAYFNGHGFLARWLAKAGMGFKQRDNSFTQVDDPECLQKAANQLSASLIEYRFNYWSFRLGPKFSRKERKAMGGLRRYWCFAQVEYCVNFIFKRNRPIRDLFVRSCDLGLMTLTIDKISHIFGRRVTRRIQGKLATVLERMDEGHHVLRAYFKRSFVKQYEKWRTFLRLEVVSNDVRDLGLKRKGLREWGRLRTKMKESLGRFAETAAVNLNNGGQYELLGALARPVMQGRTKVAGIRIESVRVARLLGLLLRGAPGNMRGWRSGELYDTALRAYELKKTDYSINQLRYDLRKLRKHGIIERVAGSHCYRLTEKGMRVGILFVQIRRQVYGPLAKGQLKWRPNCDHIPDSTIERCYVKVHQAVDELVLELAA